MTEWLHIALDDYLPPPFRFSPACGRRKSKGGGAVVAGDLDQLECKTRRVDRIHRADSSAAQSGAMFIAGLPPVACATGMKVVDPPGLSNEAGISGWPIVALSACTAGQASSGTRLRSFLIHPVVGRNDSMGILNHRVVGLACSVGVLTPSVAGLDRCGRILKHSVGFLSLLVVVLNDFMGILTRSVGVLNRSGHAKTGVFGV